MNEYTQERQVERGEDCYIEREGIDEGVREREREREKGAKWAVNRARNVEGRY